MGNFYLCKHSISGPGPGKVTWGCKESVFALAVVLIAALCFLPGLGSFGILDPTDSFFIEVAREMTERHHYITALYNYTDWLDKPALSFWPIILASKLLGMNPWAARLPAALSGMALVAATYIFAAPRLGQRAAILSAAVLCSSPLFLLTGHVALSDEILGMFFGVAMLYAGTTLASQRQKINIVAYVFLALAILTKGPIPLILAFGAIVLYLCMTCSSLNEAGRKFGQLRPIVGTIILLVLCLPYFYLAHITTNGAFSVQFFLRQNVGRMLGTVNHQEPIWFYVPILFGGYFPWILYLLISIPWLKRLFARRRQLTQRQGLVIFCACWLFWVLLLFTLVPTKLPTYIVPLSPALAILVGTYLYLLMRLYKQCKGADQSWLQSRAAIIILSLPPMLSFAGSLVGLWMLPKLMAGQMSCYGILVLIGALTLVDCWLFWRRKLVQAVFSLAITFVFIGSILVPCSFLWFYQSHQLGMDKLIAIAKAQNANIAILFSRVPSVVFSMQKPVLEIKSLPELEQFCRIGHKPHLQNCLNLPELHVKQHTIASDGRWYLLNVEGYPYK